MKRGALILDERIVQLAPNAAHRAEPPPAAMIFAAEIVAGESILEWAVGSLGSAD